MRYSRYASVLRWLTISLLAYVATVFAVGVPWLTVAHNLVVPHIQLSGDYLAIVVAVFGTTISPYLFFWQAAEEVEDEKEDPTPHVPALMGPDARGDPQVDLGADQRVRDRIEKVMDLDVIVEVDPRAPPFRELPVGG